MRWHVGTYELKRIGFQHHQHGRSALCGGRALGLYDLGQAGGIPTGDGLRSLTVPGEICMSGGGSQRTVGLAVWY